MVISWSNMVKMACTIQGVQKQSLVCPNWVKCSLPVPDLLKMVISWTKMVKNSIGITDDPDVQNLKTRTLDPLI